MVRMVFLMAAAMILAAGCANSASEWFEAATNGDTHKLSTLIEKGADVNAKHREFGATALMLAGFRGHNDTV